MCEEYESRETWAVTEWLTRDYDLCQMGRMIAAHGDEDDAAGAVQEWFTQEVWWEKAKTHDGRVMILDVGSVWRIDWHAVARALRTAEPPRGGPPGGDV